MMRVLYSFPSLVQVDKETLEKELREAFRLFDKEGNGYISRPTLKALLKEIADDLTDAQLDEAVDEIDEDGSGKIEFEGKDYVFRSTYIHSFRSSQYLY